MAQKEICWSKCSLIGLEPNMHTRSQTLQLKVGQGKFRAVLFLTPWQSKGSKSRECQKTGRPERVHQPFI